MGFPLLFPILTPNPARMRRIRNKRGRNSSAGAWMDVGDVGTHWEEGTDPFPASLFPQNSLKDKGGCGVQEVMENSPARWDADRSHRWIPQTDPTQGPSIGINSSSNLE